MRFRRLIQVLHIIFSLLTVFTFIIIFASLRTFSNKHFWNNLYSFLQKKIIVKILKNQLKKDFQATYFLFEIQFVLKH